MLKNVVLWLSRFFNTIQIHRFDVPHICSQWTPSPSTQRRICFLDLKGFLGRNVNVSSRNNAREVNPRLKTYMSITTCSAEMWTMYGMRVLSETWTFHFSEMLIYFQSLGILGFYGILASPHLAPSAQNTVKVANSRTKEITKCEKQSWGRSGTRNLQRDFVLPDLWKGCFFCQTLTVCLGVYPPEKVITIQGYRFGPEKFAAKPWSFQYLDPPNQPSLSSLALLFPNMFFGDKSATSQ